MGSHPDRQNLVGEGTAQPRTGQTDLSFSELQADNSAAKRGREELSLRDESLESRLATSLAELAAVKEKLKAEMQGRVEDRLEIGQLNENLALHKKEAEMLGKELESLTYSISHDLRAPLRHILGFSNALVEDYSDKLDCTAQGFLGCIVKAGRKLESQIEALLALSRVARQQMVPSAIDLTAVARGCAVALQEAAPERRGDFVIAEDLEVRADASLIKVALEHLLSNAWKFTRGRETAVIELGCQREGASRVFFVRDNGVGFDMRYAERLFGAFQRMHQEGEFEGGGMGLATVQRIIHRHGGRVWAESAVDAGATFYFTLGE